MNKTTNCTECARPLNARNNADVVLGTHGYDDVCSVCYEGWGWENTHNDNGHDTLPEDDDERVGCWVCYPELRTYASAKKAHLERVTGRTNMSHAACDHAKTPKARAACRKANSR